VRRYDDDAIASIERGSIQREPDHGVAEGA
jgi:hypothetical protein